MKKPSYTKHKNSDWSAVYYGDALKSYFNLPSHEYTSQHWFSQFSFSGADPKIDIMFFYIRNDMKKANVPEKCRFINKKKLTFTIMLKRIFLLSKLREHMTLTFRTVKEFVTMPVYLGCSIT